MEKKAFVDYKMYIQNIQLESKEKQSEDLIQMKYMLKEMKVNYKSLVNEEKRSVMMT